MSLHSFVAQMFSVGIDILSTTVSSAKKNILAQIGDVFTGSPDRNDVEWWQHVGFVSRPPKPAAGSAACQGIVMHRSDRDVCLASRDARGQDLSGNIGDGETCLYAPGSDGNGQARVLLKADGSVNIFTKSGNSSGGQGIIFRMGADGSIAMQSQYGMFKIDSSGITLTSGSAALTLSSTGTAKLTGTIVQAQGVLANISGSVATVIGPAAQPANPLFSAIHGPSGITGVPSSNVWISA